MAEHTPSYTALARTMSETDLRQLQEACMRARDYKTQYLELQGAIWTVLSDQHRGPRYRSQRATQAEKSALEIGSRREWEVERRDVHDYLLWARDPDPDEERFYTGPPLDLTVAYYLAAYSRNEDHWNTVLGLMEAEAKRLPEYYRAEIAIIRTYESRKSNLEDFYAFVTENGVNWWKERPKRGKAVLRWVCRKFASRS